MLTRASAPRSGTPLEVRSVAEQAQDRLRDASSVPDPRSRRCRHAGSRTKRAAADGLSATCPRGAAQLATLSASRPYGQPAGGNARVFVVDRSHQPLMPCQPARARELLRKGRALIHRLHPFTIRLKVQTGRQTQPLTLKLDPGSRTTGLALVRETPNTTHALWLAELTHRGATIHKRLIRRRAFRRRRRTATLRYRAPRFHNRTRANGWLAPSLRHRVETTMTWLARLRRCSPVSALSMELARFDTQALERPGIRGVEYQQGTLSGYEVREYLLEKWGRRCQYCDAEQVPLQIDHVLSKSRGGTDRVSNLTLACQPCNQRKGNRDLRDFLADDATRFARILAQAKAPLTDAAALNSTRWALWRQLSATGLAVSTGSGGRTKWNRTRLGIPKAHALDALCVGTVSSIWHWRLPVLAITACGRGSYQRTRLTAHGFPCGYLTRQRRIHGFQTGDRVRAVVLRGKHAGIHTGRVAVRATGSFNLQTPSGTLEGISHRRCRLLQRADGYTYHLTALLPSLKGGASA
jgi:5-methylcytosine-specific restriction endonuclease McrA